MRLIVSWHVDEAADLDWLAAVSGPVSLLHFGDGSSLRRLQDACRSRGAEVTVVLPAGEPVLQAAPVVRDRYLDFFARWPTLRMCGIPSCTIVTYQHAAITPGKLYHSYAAHEYSGRGAREKFIARMPTPDEMLFQGERGKTVVAESGFPEDRCTVTGAARYDALAATVGASQSQDRVVPPSLAELAGERKIVLVLPSLAAEDGDELIAAAIDACAGESGLFVAVKPHPERPIDELASQTKAAAIVDLPVAECLAAADIVVVSYSTTGDEAVAMGIPVVSYAGVRPTMSTFASVPAAPIVHDAGGLRSAIGRMLTDESYREPFAAWREELIEATFYRLDGRSHERTLACFEAILAEGAR
jgi:hypothetical protein